MFFVKAWVLKDAEQTSGCAKASLAACAKGQALADISFTAQVNSVLDHDSDISYDKRAQATGSKSAEQVFKTIQNSVR